MPLAACSQGNAGVRIELNPVSCIEAYFLYSFTQLACVLLQVHEARVEEVISQLCSKVLTGSEEQRNICSIGVRSLS